VRASLIAAGNEVSSDIAAKGVARGLGNALTHNGLLLSPRVATIEGREAAMSFLSTAANAPTALSWEVIMADGGAPRAAAGGSPCSSIRPSPSRFLSSGTILADSVSVSVALGDMVS
jgi:hypothetical protein